MASKAVAEAFSQALTQGSSPPDSWNGIPVVAIDTIAEAPADTPAFIVIQFPVSNASRPVLGRRFFEDGGARIVLNVERGIGLEQGLEWADAIAALFRYEDLAPGLETFATESPLIDDNLENGNWLTFAIIVPYRYQFDG